jgi:hypothetical protein
LKGRNLRRLQRRKNTKIGLIVRGLESRKPTKEAVYTAEISLIFYVLLEWNLKSKMITQHLIA